MKSWRLLSVAGLAAALSACGAEPTAPELRPQGLDASASCGYLGSGICSAGGVPADTLAKKSGGK